MTVSSVKSIVEGVCFFHQFKGDLARVLPRHALCVLLRLADRAEPSEVAVFLEPSFQIATSWPGPCQHDLNAGCDHMPHELAVALAARMLLDAGVDIVSGTKVVPAELLA